MSETEALDEIWRLALAEGIPAGDRWAATVHRQAAEEAELRERHMAELIELDDPARSQQWEMRRKVEQERAGVARLLEISYLTEWRKFEAPHD